MIRLKRGDRAPGGSLVEDLAQRRIEGAAAPARQQLGVGYQTAAKMILAKYVNAKL
jgi:hypothetical protein